MLARWRRILQALGWASLGLGVLARVPVIVPGVSGGCAGVIGTGLVLYLLPSALAGLTGVDYLAFVAAVAWLLPAVTVGGAVCGWVCPLGSAQDALVQVGRRLGALVPRPLGHRRLRLARYLLLIAALVGAVWLLRPWYAVCPMHYLAASLQGRGLGYRGLERLGLALVPVLASLVVPRFFCRYLCPVGVLLRVGHGWTLLDLLVGARPACRGCAVCLTCPMGLRPNRDFPSALDCIRCGRCLECGRGG
ncbi:MAG: 4Fe-4S binding protein [Euryarchaeota archaeon]